MEGRGVTNAITAFSRLLCAVAMAVLFLCV